MLMFSVRWPLLKLHAFELNSPIKYLHVAPASVALAVLKDAGEGLAERGREGRGGGDTLKGLKEMRLEKEITSKG